MFHQCICLLADERLTIQQLLHALESAGARSIQTDPLLLIGPALPSVMNPWVLAKEWIEIPLPNASHGKVVIDLVDHVWPDDLSYPAGNTAAYEAWNVGAFGPCALSGAMARAVAKLAARQADPDTDDHSRFVRFRLYLGDPSAPRDPVSELEFMTWLCVSAMGIPGAGRCFNPGAETLSDRATLACGLEFGQSKSRPLMNLWVDHRTVDVGGNWKLRDTRGNPQLGLPEIEALYRADASTRSPESILNYLSQRMLSGQLSVEDDTFVADEFGQLWHCIQHESSLAAPNRPVVTFKHDERRGAAELERRKNQSQPKPRES